MGFPPVILAVQRHDVGLLRMMVAKGADLSARDGSGSTALMWAAANESGDAAMVDELLRMGVDPQAVNRVGESALDWAVRRGDTPAVAALRQAGASDTARIKASIEKALALLRRSGSQFAKVSGCYSCHHSALPQMASGIARTRGMAFDESAAHEQSRAALAPFGDVLQEALTNRDRIPDPPIGLSYALVSLAAVNYPADEMTRAMTRVIAAWQSDDGAFHTLPAIRPPLESDDFTATALSLRALQLYGTHSEAPVARARDWLRRALPRSTEERAMHLLGLTWANAPADEIGGSMNALLALQSQDGGWAQLPGLETDAYATGQALVALQTAGVAIASAEYRRGTAFLMRTQLHDGSWLVRTRTFPVQPPKDTGFPHGKHQWISAAGTSWAAMALALTLPEPPSVDAIR